MAAASCVMFWLPILKNEPFMLMFRPLLRKTSRLNMSKRYWGMRSRGMGMGRERRAWAPMSEHQDVGRWGQNGGAKGAKQGDWRMGIKVPGAGAEARVHPAGTHSDPMRYSSHCSATRTAMMVASSYEPRSRASVAMALKASARPAGEATPSRACSKSSSSMYSQMPSEQTA